MRCNGSRNRESPLGITAKIGFDTLRSYVPVLNAFRLYESINNCLPSQIF